MNLTVYVSIGNSDDKLPQADWSDFADSIIEAVTNAAEHLHGIWFSESSSPYQNACMCAEVHQDAVARLRERLTEIRRRHGQESVAWAVAPRTEFI